MSAEGAAGCHGDGCLGAVPLVGMNLKSSQLMGEHTLGYELITVGLVGPVAAVFPRGVGVGGGKRPEFSMGKFPLGQQSNNNKIKKVRAVICLVRIQSHSQFTALGSPLQLSEYEASMINQSAALVNSCHIMESDGSLSSRHPRVSFC